MRAVRQTISSGVVIGLVLAAAVLAVIQPGRRAPTPRPGPALPDCRGRIAELVIQYVPAAAQVVAPVYAELLPLLPAGVTVHVVCPSDDAFADLTDRVGPVECTLSPVIVDHEMSAWSRDRWLAMAPQSADEPITLLAPRGENGADRWPARAGDARIVEDLAAALAPRVTWLRSELYFDGGDFVVDGRWAFVTPAVAMRNIQHTLATRAELVDALRRRLGRDVLLLNRAPPHHAGMFMMPIGDGRVLVGDPSLARRLVADAAELDGLLPDGADFSEATQALFDAVADQCRQTGLEVIRVPTASAPDGRTYLAYLNAILDVRDGRHIVYMPTYEGAELLNAAAAEVWQRAGYEVRRVDCTSAYRHGGSLRCLVNVLRRR